MESSSSDDESDDSGEPLNALEVAELASIMDESFDVRWSEDYNQKGEKRMLLGFVKSSKQ